MYNQHTGIISFYILLLEELKMYFSANLGPSLSSAILSF
jgi:hypothetical protein